MIVNEFLPMLKKYPFIFVFFLQSAECTAQVDIAANQALIKRIVPTRSNDFVVEPLPVDENAFEIESRGKKIILRGNNGVAIASALYYYLNEYCHCQVTWNGINLNLPESLPEIPEKIRKTSPYQHRYYLNYCTFNYTMSWWDWDRWEKEIDWMALHGINMPLSITGQEYVWNEVYKSMGFSDEDLMEFFSGPAYFAWFWMGNLDAWEGPLSKHWMKSHKELQQRILQRERELGMTPVLPAFTGHVPPSFKKLFPNAKLKQTNWGNGFADTYILDSEDPMFAEIGKKFIEAQTRIYGTDHFYSADTFNENEPPSDEPSYIAEMGKRVYEGMKSADPDAVWLMQGWLFYSDKEFWKAPQIKALLVAVPDDKMIILDLAAEIEPVWKRIEAFYGKPWVWNMLHNFGGNISLFGRIDGIASGPAEALNNPESGKLTGIGLTMEGLEQNPVLYELMTSHTWRNSPVDLDSWLAEYIQNRYGSQNEHALKAWEVLRKTVYNGRVIRDGAESIIVARPTFESGRRWARTTLNYNPGELLPAWDELILASSACRKFDGFQYDLVDVSRQVLANYALVVHKKIVEAYEQRDVNAFEDFSKQFIELIDDIDKLLATRQDFLLGPWVADARKWGITDQEKAVYERNAKNLITLWGDAESPLNEYACRQWSGLLDDFYKPRWQHFFEVVMKSIKSGGEIDMESFDEFIRQWEWHWVNGRKDYPVEPIGNPIELSKQIYKKYRLEIGKAYQANQYPNQYLKD